MAKFTHLGNTQTYKTCFYREIKPTSNLWNACNHLFQNLLPFQSLYKSMITQRYVILPVLLYGCETWYHVSHITEITQAGNVQEQGTAENI